MNRFVKLTDLLDGMKEFAPPAWCKMAIQGALTSDIELYAAEGYFRAYLPPYHLTGEQVSNGLPPKLLHRRASESSIIERYGLENHPKPNLEAIILWEEKFDDEPQRIATGWYYFVEEWDWLNPEIRYDGFEIPTDYEGLFGYDDLHPEGEPEYGPYYEARFAKLCVTLREAERILPMKDLGRVSFAGKEFSAVRKIGRPRGSGYENSDEAIVKQMIADWKEDKTLKSRQLAETYADSAAGHGTRISKVKRLQARLRTYGI